MTPERTTASAEIASGGQQPLLPTRRRIVHAVRDVGFYGLTQQVLALKGLILLPVLTRQLSLHEYGVYSLATVSVAFVTWLLPLGLPSAIIRFLPGEPLARVRREVAFAIATTLGASVLGILGLLLFRGGVAQVLFNDPARLTLAAAVLLFASMEALRAVAFTFFRVCHQVPIYLRLEVVTQTTMVAAMAAVVLRSPGLVGIFLAQAAVSCGVVAYVLARHVRPVFQLPSAERMAEYLRFSLPVMVPSLMVWFLPRVDRYIISGSLGQEAVAVYSANCALGGLVQAVGSSVAFVYEPLLAAHWNRGERAETVTNLAHALTLFLFLAVPMTAGLWFVGEGLMRSFATPDYAVTARVVMVPVALAYVSYAFYGFGVNTFLLQRRVLTGTTFSIAGGLTSVSLNLWLIPKLGLHGAAVSMLAAHLLIAVTAVAAAWRVLPIRLRFADLAVIAIATAAMSVALASTAGVVTQVILRILLGLVVYAVVVTVLKWRTLSTWMTDWKTHVRAAVDQPTPPS